MKKCLSDDCHYCILSPPRIPVDEFHFLPDPVIQGGEYLSFEELYGKVETDDAQRPSAQAGPKVSERDKSFKSVLVASKYIQHKSKQKTCVYCIILQKDWLRWIGNFIF